MEAKDISHSITKTYRKTILKKVIKAIDEYELIKAGDKIAVCISGGKDSFLLALILQDIKRHRELNFKLEYILMDPGYTKATLNNILENAKLLGLDLHVFKSTIFEDIKDEKNPCYVCARKRRGHLYNKAKELGCSKIALGHHYDDVIETIMLNLLYAGSFGSMLPKLKSTNYPDMELIRPLYLVREKDIINWANYNNLTFTNCACDLANKELNSKRLEMKNLIKELKKVYIDVDKNIFNSSINVNLNTLLGYKDDVSHSFLDDY